MTGARKPVLPQKWGYGWVAGKRDKEKGKEIEAEENEKSSQEGHLISPVVRRDSKFTQSSRRTQDSAW
jgi:hypothetical protein